MALDEIEIEITGLDEIDRAMAKFPAEFNRTAIADGVEAAAAYLGAMAQGLAPELTEGYGSREPGELRKSIGVYMRKVSADRPELTTAWVGPMYGVSGSSSPEQDPGKWGQYVEFGSEHNRVPEPYLRPALDGGAAAAFEIFVQTVSAHFNENSEGAGI